MDTLTAISSRRSVKHFDPNHRMSEAEEEQLLQLALLSPTAFNIQHWRFLVVRDPQLRQQLRQLSWNQPQVTDSSLYVILCADLQAWNKEPERYWQNAAEHVRQWIVKAMADYYGAFPQTQRDEAIRSCGMAAQTIMLAAKAMGYDSCPMAGFDYAAVGALIRLPADHIVVMSIAIGKPLQPAQARAGQLPLSVVRLLDRFPEQS
ncbi:nitroreductase family protein [Candidatus Magnetaquicoccus inordinatus]|uniref:nitroreductase family protein n=1 Tax=Candidatus Magnetaquicoccus inordinatus TaxID=2496818 RepID=UPI00102C1047|nr:nitroreductase family protein [Candidatus Magnetaquicoccus inordinatus]